MNGSLAVLARAHPPSIRPRASYRVAPTMMGRLPDPLITMELHGVRLFVFHKFCSHQLSCISSIGQNGPRDGLICGTDVLSSGLVLWYW